MKRPMVMLEWEDAGTYINKHISEVVLDQPLLVRTYGLLTKHKGYHIVMTHDGEEDNCDFIKIPNSIVRKVTYLK